MSENDASTWDDDVRGTWTVTFEGGPATAVNLAVTLRTMNPRSWTARTPAMSGFVERLASALDRAEFTPAGQITLKRRPPEEVRKRLLVGGMPPDLVEEFMAQEFGET